MPVFKWRAAQKPRQFAIVLRGISILTGQIENFGQVG
jgi:hypothetical protein